MPGDATPGSTHVSPEQEPPDRQQRAPRERWLARAAVTLVLGVLAAGVLLRAPGFVGGREPIGFDASSHVLAAAAGARAWRADAPGFWVAELNLGFPLGHFYQPLPHAATAAASLLAGGPEQATRTYKVLVSALLALLPFSAFVGFRRLGLGVAGALGAALALATIAVPMKYFGLAPRHYLEAGLYTLLWGAVLAPLALAAGVRFVRGRGPCSSAVILYALLFLCHGLMGLALVPVFLFTALALPAAGDGGLRGRFLRVLALGLLAGVGIAFWLLPQLMCADYFGGWPFGHPDRVNGYGLDVVLRRWLRGRFTDLGRAPVVTWLSVAGLVAALVTWRRRPLGRLVLFATVLFACFAAGRPTFGAWVDRVYPPNARIELGRYVGVLHLFLALAAGFAVDALARLAERRAPRLAGWVVLVPVLLLPLVVPSYERALREGMVTAAPEGEHATLVAFAEVLAAEGDPGRVYTGEPLGIKGPLLGVHTSLASGKPMTVSFGVGLQDSLNAYYLAGFDPTDPERAAREARLFNVRYLITGFQPDLGDLVTRRLATRGRRELHRIEGDYGYFEVIGPPRAVAGDPIGLRERFARWLKEEHGAGARFLRLEDPVGLRFPRLPGATVDYRAHQAEDVARAGTPPADAGRSWGVVLEERVGEGRFAARVRGDDARSWVLLKATPHPFWTATLDGERVPVHHLAPSMIGVELGAGEHEVELVFRNPRWQGGLLLLGVVVLAGLVVHDLRRGRSARATGA